MVIMTIDHDHGLLVLLMLNNVNFTSLFACL